MTSNNLNDLLRRLHEELARGATLDAQGRALIEQVSADLRRVGDAAPTPSATGLRALALRFEAEHPGIAATLNGIADVLGKAGV